MKPKFIQIHTLTGYSSVLLNRDDSGMAKRIEYGTGVRTRTSSQFAKRKMRTSTSSASLLDIGQLGVRSKLLFRKPIAEALIAEGMDKSAVAKVALGVMDLLYKPSEKAKTNRKKAADEAAKNNVEVDSLDLLERDELLIFGQTEIAFIKSIIRDIVVRLDPEMMASDKADKHVTEVTDAYFAETDVKKTLRKMPNQSLDIAAFGRMVTGDSLSTVDAAVHVAHALSVHTQQSEVDYFTAVDDLKNRDQGDDAGGGHVGETEINSPLLYGYYVVDFDLLVANLSGLDNAREVAAKMASRIVELAATSIVGAKKGSTAPYSTADFILVEVGDDAPRSLAEAFREPARPVIGAAVEKLVAYATQKEAIYGAPSGHRFVMSLGDVSLAGAERTTLIAASKRLEAILTAGEAV
jgi:CRISPR system Cascade subunit CasC